MQQSSSSTALITCLCCVAYFVASMNAEGAEEGAGCAAQRGHVAPQQSATSTALNSCLCCAVHRVALLSPAGTDKDAE
jgi:hypothetical protein